MGSPPVPADTQDALCQPLALAVMASKYIPVLKPQTAVARATQHIWHMLLKAWRAHDPDPPTREQSQPDVLRVAARPASFRTTQPVLTAV
jgi:hypothetical protein